MKGIGRSHYVRAILLGLVLLLIEVDTYASPANHNKDKHSGQNSKTGKTEKSSRKRPRDSSADARLQDNAPPISRRRTEVETNPIPSQQPLYLLQAGDNNPGAFWVSEDPTYLLQRMHDGDLDLQLALLASMQTSQPCQNDILPSLEYRILLSPPSPILWEHHRPIDEDEDKDEDDDEFDHLLRDTGAMEVLSLHNHTRLMLENLFKQSPVSGENVASLIPGVIQGYSSDNPLPAISPHAFVHIVIVSENDYSRLIVGYYDLAVQACLYIFSDSADEVVVYRSDAHDFYTTVLNALKKMTSMFHWQLETHELYLSQTISELTALLSRQPTEPNDTSIQDVTREETMDLRYRTEINRYIHAFERRVIHSNGNMPEPASNRVPATNGFRRQAVAEYLCDLIRQGQVGDFVYQEHDSNEIYSFTRFEMDEDQKHERLVQQIISTLRSSRQSKPSSELLVAVCSTELDSPPLILYLQIDGESVLMSQHSRSDAIHNLPGPSGEQILLVDLSILAEALSSLKALDEIYFFHRQQ